MRTTRRCPTAMRRRAGLGVAKLAERLGRPVDADGPVRGRRAVTRRVEIMLHAPRRKPLVATARRRYTGVGAQRGARPARNAGRRRSAASGSPARHRRARDEAAAHRRPPAGADARHAAARRTWTAPAALERVITSPNISSPGLVLAGYTDRFPGHRLQVLGETEVTYLRSRDPAERARVLQLFFSHPIPCVFVTKGQTLARRHGEAAARRRGVPILTSRSRPTSSTRGSSRGSRTSSRRRTNLHGSLADVFGVGLLFTGAQRHRQVRVRARPRRARPPPRGRRPRDRQRRGDRRAHRPRARDAAALHGDPRRRAHRHAVDLRHPRRAPAEAHRGRGPARGVGRRTPYIDRTGLDGQTTTILDVELPKITVPLNPGKNITVIAEVIAMNHLLQVQRLSTRPSGSTSGSSAACARPADVEAVPAGR